MEGAFYDIKMALNPKYFSKSGVALCAQSQKGKSQLTPGGEGAAIRQKGPADTLRIEFDAVGGLTLKLNGNEVLNAPNSLKMTTVNRISFINESGSISYFVDNVIVEKVVPPNVVLLDARQRRMAQISGPLPKAGSPGERENLAYIAKLIERCQKEDFDRELAYWQKADTISRLRLRVLQAETDGDKSGLPPAELDALRAKLPENRLAGPALAAAKKTRSAVDAALVEAGLPHSWLLVKNRLTADLADRLSRAEFYTGAGDATAPLQREAQALALGAREWEKEYGECFFGCREQELEGIGCEEAEKLVVRAQALPEKTSALESRRADLEARLLAALRQASPSGAFADLGIPRREKITISPKGMPSNLLFSGLDFGMPYIEKRAKQADPLCFDVLDFSFFGLPLASRHEAMPLDKRLDIAVPLAKEDGYYFKQPLTVESAYRTSHYRNLKHLPEASRDRKELFLQNQEGEPVGMHNIWHPEILSLTADSLAAAAKAAVKNIPNLLFFEHLAWETGGLGNYKDVYGYNAEALDAFRKQLEARYGTIQKLNAEWGTDYAGFEAITFPRSPFNAPISKPSALSYEFQRFRNDSWSDFIAHCVRAVQSGAPGLPVGTEEFGINGTFINGTVPSHRLWKKSPAIFIEDHHNNWSPSYPALRMHYDLCLAADKQPIETEWIWTYPRLVQPKNEDEFRATGQLSFWRKMVWGRKLLQVHNPSGGWGYRHNYYDEAASVIHNRDVGQYGPFVREAATGLVLTKKRAREFWPVLSTTEVAKPPVGLLVPTASMLNEYPFQTLSFTYPLYERTFIRWATVLGSGQIAFRHIPEEAILDGDESLASYKVLILPYMTYFPAGLAEKLIAWVKAGGTLIAEGVPDVYDAHARPTGTLPAAAFGDALKWTYTGDKGQGVNWSYDFALSPGKHAVRALVGPATAPTLVEAPLGQGRILMSSRTFGDFADLSAAAALGNTKGLYEVDQVVKVGGGDDDLGRALFRAITEKCGPPAVVSENNAFELVLRESPDGKRFLFGANPSLSETVTANITLNFPCKSAADLGLGPKMEVPVRQLPGGNASLQLRLAPGEGTCLALQNQ
jgi:hypothetical protein